MTPATTETSGQSDWLTIEDFIASRYQSARTPKGLEAYLGEFRRPASFDTMWLDFGMKPFDDEPQED